jgi:hypothetical protein
MSLRNALNAVFAIAGIGALSCVPCAIAQSGQPATHSRRGFPQVAIGLTAGASGIGGQFAIETSRNTNLRFAGNGYSYSRRIYADGVTYAGNLKFRSATANLDWFPLHGEVRLSPGVTFYNGNRIDATASVPGGHPFYLNGNGYISSPTDPIHGTGSLTFGNKVAPNFTIGVGNMIPRSGRHFSMPFEAGFQYISQMHVQLNLQGTACNDFGCADIGSNSTVQANVKAEQDELNRDLYPFRFYPILSLGVAYKF